MSDKELPMLNVENLMVFYENAIAINELSLHVDEGEIVGIIGSNSAGKTTLMNTVSGLILDTKLKEQRKGGERITIFGTIRFHDRDITNLWADERVKLGIVLSRERHPVFVESDTEENLKIASYLTPKNQTRENEHSTISSRPAPLTETKSRSGAEGNNRCSPSECRSWQNQS